MKSIKALFLLLAATLPCKADEKAAEKKAPPATGVVYKVEGKNKPLYLCGSIHLLKESDYPLPKPYEQAYEKSEHLVFEIEPGEMEKPENMGLVMKMSMLKKGGLKDVVSEETMQALEKWSKESEFPMLALQNMKPWMVGVLIAQTVFSKKGMKPELGVDMHFARRATKDKKTQAGLETIEFQLGIFDGLSPKLQEQMILEALKEASDVDEMLEKMDTAWRTGDGDKLAEVMNEGFKDFPDVKKKLLDERNASWIEPIEKMLNGDKTVMVVVGAGHLAGKGSVLDLLKQKGWKIEAVK